MLTRAQATALRDAINANTNATFVGYRNNGQTDMMADWYNQPNSVDAWMSSASKLALFEATDITKYDTLTAAGKRDAWRLMMENAPIDFGRNSMRKAVVDIWGPLDSIAVLQAMLEKATRGQVVFGGSSKTTNTVTGLDRAFSGLLTGQDISQAMSA